MWDYVKFALVLIIVASASVVVMETGIHFGWWGDYYLTGIGVYSFILFAFLTTMEILDWFKWNRIVIKKVE